MYFCRDDAAMAMYLFFIDMDMILEGLVDPYCIPWAFFYTVDTYTLIYVCLYISMCVCVCIKIRIFIMMIMCMFPFIFLCFLMMQMCCFYFDALYMLWKFKMNSHVNEK